MRYEQNLLPDWAAMTPKKFEELVASMLLQTYPDGKRFDGRGGDGGVDFVVQRPNGDLVFQVKHFPGRVGATQRRQVERSISAVVERSSTTGRALTGWVLVVPTDLTPGEDQKLQELCVELPCPSQWYGKSWLATESSKYPFLLFAHLNQAGSARAIVQDELAALANPIVNIDDIRNAQAMVRKHASSLSPDFDVFTASTPDGTQIRLQPRPGSAFRLDLNTIAHVAGADAVEGLRFGQPITFEAAASDLGFPAGLIDDGVGQWTFSGTDGPEVEVRLEVLDRRGRIIADLRFPPATAKIGTGGAQITTTDRTGWVQLQFRLVPTSGPNTLNFAIEPDSAAYPEDIVALIEFFDAISDDGAARVTVRIGDNSFPTEPTAMFRYGAPFDQQFCDYVRDVQYLQRYTGHEHPINANHDDDEQAISHLTRGLQGESVELDATMTIELISVPDELTAEEGFAVAVTHELTGFRIQGVEHSIPKHTQLTTCSHVRANNRDEILQARADGRSCTASLVTKDGYLWNVTLEETASDDIPPGGDGNDGRTGAQRDA